MAIKQPISKKNLQEKLYKMGASPILIQMPAVIERLHQEYMSFENTNFDIGENGEIITHDGIFKEKENSEAEYESDELKIEIDSFGMEKSAEVKSTKSVTQRKDKTITYDEPFDGLYFGPYNFEYSDNAMALLDDVFEYATSYQENLPLKTTLDENMGYLLMNYPQTEGWFIQKGFLPHEPLAKNEAIKKALEAEKQALLRTLNVVPDDSIPAFLSKSLSVEQENSIKSEIDRIERFIKQSTIKFPRKNFSREESEDNRLVFYYEQIQNFKKNEELEEKEIELIKRFVSEECAGIPIIGNKITNKINDIVTGDNTEPDEYTTETEQEPKSVLAKGRKTLDYVKRSATAKSNLRKKMKSTIINEFASLPAVGKKAKVIVTDRMNEFRKKNDIPDFQEPNGEDRVG